MDLRNLINSAVSKIQQGIKTTAGNVGRAVYDFKTDLPANFGYLQNKVNKSMMPKFDLPASDNFKMASPEEIKQSKLIADLGPGITKSMSAQMAWYPETPNTPTSNYIQEEKQKVLANSGLRPAMQRYLSTVPIFTSQPNKEFSGQYYPQRSSGPDVPWELSYGPDIPTINIPVSPKADLGKMKDGKFTQSVLLHELAHATMPIRGTGKRIDFQRFFKQVSPEKTPLLYQIGLKYYQDGRAPPNAEELYATLAQNLGAQALNIPEIKNFYSAMFTQPTTSNVPQYQPNLQYAKISGPIEVSKLTTGKIKIKSVKK